MSEKQRSAINGQPSAQEPDREGLTATSVEREMDSRIVESWTREECVMPVPQVGQVVDLRSDTLTTPTPEMRKAMAEAEVGDDVFGEDPTVRRLEALAAERLGKEAGLFVASGTMGNQVCLMAHTQRGDEIILDEDSHIVNYEVGGLAVLSAVQARMLRGEHGILDPDEIRRAIRPPNIHHPQDRLICLESTHNRGGGSIYPLETLRAIRRLAQERGVAVHLDGARLFNACVASGDDVREVAAQADSVTFCLSKGLAAPVGSVIVGTAPFIERARRARKMLGGGMRQVGILAAAGILALETMVERLAEDHDNARRLAEGLAALPGIRLDPKRVQTNIVIFEVARQDLDAPGLQKKLFDQGVKSLATGPTRIRMVTHKDVSRDGIERALKAMKDILEG